MAVDVEEQVDRVEPPRFAYLKNSLRHCRPLKDTYGPKCRQFLAGMFPEMSESPDESCDRGGVNKSGGERCGRTPAVSPPANSLPRGNPAPFTGMQTLPYNSRLCTDKHGQKMPGKNVLDTRVWRDFKISPSFYEDHLDRGGCQTLPWAATALPAAACPEARDVRKCGYLRKVKHNQRRFFVLRGPSYSGPSRLECYESEKSFRHACRPIKPATTSKTWSNKRPVLGSNPGKVLQLQQCFSVSKRAEGRNQFVLALCSRGECLLVAAEDGAQQEEWYQALTQAVLEERRENLSQELDEELVDDGYWTVPPGSAFREVWHVKVRGRGLGQTISGLAGGWRMGLGPHSLHLLRPGGVTASITLSLTSVRRCGHAHNQFFLEMGRSSPVGPGEIWMQVGSSAEAQSMHETILDSMRALRTIPDFRPRSHTMLSLTPPGPMAGPGGVGDTVTPSGRHHRKLQASRSARLPLSRNDLDSRSDLDSSWPSLDPAVSPVSSSSNLVLSYRSPNHNDEAIGSPSHSEPIVAGSPTGQVLNHGLRPTRLDFKAGPRPTNLSFNPGASSTTRVPIPGPNISRVVPIPGPNPPRVVPFPVPCLPSKRTAQRPEGEETLEDYVGMEHRGDLSGDWGEEARGGTELVGEERGGEGEERGRFEGEEEFEKCVEDPSHLDDYMTMSPRVVEKNFLSSSFPPAFSSSSVRYTFSSSSLVSASCFSPGSLSSTPFSFSFSPSLSQVYSPQRRGELEEEEEEEVEEEEEDEREEYIPMSYPADQHCPPVAGLGKGSKDCPFCSLSNLSDYPILYPPNLCPPNLHIDPNLPGPILSPPNFTPLSLAASNLPVEHTLSSPTLSSPILSPHTLPLYTLSSPLLPSPTLSPPTLPLSTLPFLGLPEHHSSLPSLPASNLTPSSLHASKLPLAILSPPSVPAPSFPPPSLPPPNIPAPNLPPPNLSTSNLPPPSVPSSSVSTPSLPPPSLSCLHPSLPPRCLATSLPESHSILPSVPPFASFPRSFPAPSPHSLPAYQTRAPASPPPASYHTLPSSLRRFPSARSSLIPPPEQVRLGVRLSRSSRASCSSAPSHRGAALGWLCSCLPKCVQSKLDR